MFFKVGATIVGVLIILFGILAYIDMFIFSLPTALVMGVGYLALIVAMIGMIKLAWES